MSIIVTEHQQVKHTKNKQREIITSLNVKGTLNKVYFQVILMMLANPAPVPGYVAAT